MNFIQCECGTFHFHGACFCEGCGAQPPKPHGTGRDDANMDDSNAEDFCATVIALTRALESTRGKWGVA